MKPVKPSKFFERRVPTSWIEAKQKEDVLDALARPSDLAKERYTLIRPVVLINGAFDILHPAHLRLINEARWRAGTLVALLDSDAKVKRRKGPNRPVFTWQERATSLFYCGCDIIVEVDSEEDFLEAVEAVQPDARVLGAEYKGKPSRLPHIHTIYIADRGVHTSDVLRRILKR